jgi:hypothetical protein
MKVASLLFLSVAMIAGSIAYAAQNAQAPTGALRIVVIEGEDSVNVIQQGTAVAPVVEVRDRNNLPVAGATVQFTIARTGNAAAGTFANGQTTVSVTTNAAGRATASQIQAVGRGALRIQVQANYQGQVANATISQTNVATAADAAKLSRSGATSGAGGVAGTAGAVAGVAAAGVSAATAVTHAKAEQSCQASGDRALAAITFIASTCLPGDTSAQCTQAGADATATLGEWCSCAGGRPQLETELSIRGTTVAELRQEAALRNVTFPNACR